VAYNATGCREFLNERLKTCRFFVPEDHGAVSLPHPHGGGAREDEADVPFGKDYVAAVARREGRVMRYGCEGGEEAGKGKKE
jgi:hypothetical protein